MGYVRTFEIFWNPEIFSTLIYTEARSFDINAMLCNPVKIKHGVRQGCPPSALSFPFEPLALINQTEHIVGIEQWTYLL